MSEPPSASASVAPDGVSGNGTAATAAAAAASSTADSPGGTKSGAAKDKNCPYCGQAFTSSSLGRHLDLYIKDKNPKPPDGVHDVDGIRKMRSGITRRQPRGSLARRDSSIPNTPVAFSRKSPPPDSSAKPSAIPKEGQFVVDHQVLKSPFPQLSWEATGVINDISARNGDTRNSREDSTSQDASTRSSVQRAPSRALQKTQLDAKQKLADAMDTARAAELALRELLSSWRAAKQHIDMNTLPFDFDPLSLDFPALTLQCLQAPPTLFSSTPHPTSTSWSIQPPAQKQYEALKTYFQEEFRKWRVACATATTATSEELTYPPSNSLFPQDIREGVKKAERAAASLEKQVQEHLQSTYQVWDQLPEQRRSELWGLELARSVGRRQKDVDNLKEAQRSMKTENANLKIQLEQLNRLQQPREFRIVPPATIPIEESLMAYLLDLGARGMQGVGLTNDDRHVDLNTMVSRAIDRWKTVIVSARGSGMSGQRSFAQPTSMPTPTSATAPGPTIQQQQQQHHHHHHHHQQQGSVPHPASFAQTEHKSTGAVTAIMSADDENSDQDADAEMEDDDGFTPVTPAVAKIPAQQQSQLEVSRTRGQPPPRINSNPDARFLVNGTGNNRNLHMRQPMGVNANNPTALAGRNHGQRGHVMDGNDYGTVVQGVGGGDPMYMD
ncbi:hypothetical protein F4778DRAFT_758384 [Xylariomycetidae sp. FL2044]|nr:hypothetical protein F4778DRAFT_758384 [Xylariomycetidae sp. FL2044]